VKVAQASPWTTTPVCVVASHWALATSTALPQPMLENWYTHPPPPSQQTITGVAVLAAVGVRVAVGVIVAVAVIVAVGVIVALGVMVAVGVGVGVKVSQASLKHEACCTMIGGVPLGQSRLHSPPAG
jgi:hypothetical protein